MRAYHALQSPAILASRWPWNAWAVPGFRRFVHRAFDATFDREQLAEARKWHQSFQLSSLPEGNTSYSRSSGPGGQHVNKTETKATTTWPVPQLLSILPKLLHAGVRESKYYTRRNDCLTIQAQTHRSRSANAEENRRKLFEALQELYHKTVPGESSPEKAKKYEALKKSANEARMKEKRMQKLKKASRRGFDD
ncbi:hypothetical protein VTH06DRAFT_5523 [Thermothelomyces fergusii]